MKTYIFSIVAITVLLFIYSCDNDKLIGPILNEDYWGTASVVINGELKNGFPKVEENQFSPGVYDLRIKFYNEEGYRRGTISIFKFSLVTEWQEIVNTSIRLNDGQVGSLFTTNILDGDVLGSAYHPFSSELVSSRIVIDSINEDLIFGSFELAYAIDSLFIGNEVGAMDTVFVQNGMFSSKIF